MKKMRPVFTWALVALLISCTMNKDHRGTALFDKENLVAWCIVPFDAADRTPLERAKMLDDLGIAQLAYDYRDEHIPVFPEEIRVMEEHGIAMRAVWMWIHPRSGEVLGEANRRILEILGETGTETEIWVSFPGQVFEGLTEKERLDTAVAMIGTVLNEARQIGCTVALYNHGDWFGEPANQVEIIREIGSRRLGIVYNFHHAHPQMDRFEENLEIMLPYLTSINLNGMRAEGPKILPLGEGNRELEMMRTIARSGFTGTIGIIGHTEGKDIRPVLEENLEGLEKLVLQL